MSNIEHPRWEERDCTGFRSRRARIGREAGCRRLGASLWELPPGEASYPYHFHLTEEELLIVLRGRPQLRTPDGWRQLEQGDVVSFPVGEPGAHQLLNGTERTVEFISISTSGEPDIVIYPDSAKLGATAREPDGSGLAAMFRLSDVVDYWDGEAAPSPERPE